MKSLVLELQSDSQNSDICVSALLRKAYVVARKLKIIEFEKWLNSELNGYECDSNDIPKYRSISGSLKGFDHYRGWIPVYIDNSEMANLLLYRKVPDPISIFEDVLIKNGTDSLVLKYPSETNLTLAKLVRYQTEFQLFFSKSQVVSILDTVRNVVLEWSLKLEEDGILGESMLFTEQEKIVAQEKNYTVINFYGNVSHSQIQHDSVNSPQTMNNEVFDIKKISELIELLKDHFDSVGCQPDQKNIIQSQIDLINAQLKSTKPNSSIISEGLKTIRNILEGATGSLIAAGLLYRIGEIIH